ncbi:MAG: sugar phosphate isomerase/epimerase [Syntrophales bacterium]|nr:sugar phosphate isomerase/epimerase [Syntrophales bacterium]
MKLPRLKGKLPFRIGTTSYIIPADVAANICLLGSFVDEIELVLYEGFLPSREEVLLWGSLKREYNLQINVHLPMAIPLGDPDFKLRRKGCDKMLQFMERLNPLEPTTYILHLEQNGNRDTGNEIRNEWINCLRDSLNVLRERGMNPDKCAVENLNYPLSWIEDLINDFHLKVCLDTGHLLLQGANLHYHFEKYRDKIIMIHLHGLSGGLDHSSITDVSETAWKDICGFLENYFYGVSLEVFSLEDLRSSLEKLKRAFPWVE